MKVNIGWDEFKNFVATKGVPVQYLSLSNKYYVSAFDGTYSVFLELYKNGNPEVVDFEDNYKADGNKNVKLSLTEADSETGGLKFTPRYQKPGWLQQLFEVEFETATLNSIHEKDIANVDIGWSSLKFYKDVATVETEWTPADQADLTANCIRTDFLWMPTVDYQLLAGKIVPLTAVAQDVYVWGVGIDLDTPYGGPQVVFAEGGINMAYVDAKKPVGLDGKGAPFLYYDKVKTGEDAEGNPIFTALPAGVGSNRMRFIVRHPVGLGYRMQVIFEIFRG